MRLASSWGWPEGNVPDTRPLVSSLSQAWKPGRLLDIGCGDGKHAVLFASRGFEVTGIETARSALDLAQKRANEAGVAVRFKHADMREVPEPDASFDYVIAIHSLYHTDLDGMTQALTEVRRTLKPHYKALITLLSDRYPHGTSYAVSAHTYPPHPQGGGGIGTVFCLPPYSLLLDLLKPLHVRAVHDIRNFAGCQNNFQFVFELASDS